MRARKRSILNSADDIKGHLKQANVYHRRVVKGHKYALKYAIKCGETLYKAKKYVRHGRWIQWLEDNFEGKPRTAQAYMRVFNRQGELESDADLSINKALMELASRRKKSGKHFDPVDLIQSRIYKLLLKEVWKGWSNEEIEWVKESLKGDSLFNYEIQECFNQLHVAVQKKIRASKRDKPSITLDSRRVKLKRSGRAKGRNSKTVSNVKLATDASASKY